jgi:L-serine dehydratase
MNLSVFDLFSIGIGPSSSHTVGPMRAAKQFLLSVPAETRNACTKIVVLLYGSLALTGKGHGTDGAVLAGLEGFDPETIDPASVPQRLLAIKQGSGIVLLGEKPIAFDYETDLQWLKKHTLPLHSNALGFKLFDQHQQCLAEDTYYSIGGGFIATAATLQTPKQSSTKLPYPFTTAKELFTQCRDNHLTIAALMRQNELTWRSNEQIDTQLLHIAEIMEGCIQRGLTTEGILPGGLKVIRRAPNLYQKLIARGTPEPSMHPESQLWPTLFAMAVNEENAAGGRIVTAPTNGAAGIIPAVLTYYKKFYQNANNQQVIDFLLTAAAIGFLYKFGASISGAEVGCQGEVGVACSMAAGALTAVLGGTLAQIENAAEMAMEHHLGMTCDPIAGLVQIPCIERNGVAAEKAIKLTQLALLEDGLNKKVSLDIVIKTMLRTGQDMMMQYKETALGGLAANQIEC